jgi:thiol-disulfide isomerase/thioredoxin
MRRLLLFIVVAFGVYAAVKQFEPAVRFSRAEDVLQVKRLQLSGEIAREEFQPRRAPYLAVYHGASWCPPCQQFSPRLSKFYRDADKSKARFQLIMVNYDPSDAAMAAYMRQHKMEFPAVRRGDAGGWGSATGTGIPNLMIIDTATNKVVSSSFNGSEYQGCDVPLGVLKTIIAQGHP